MFIEKISSFIRYSLREYWDSNTQANFTNVSFNAQCQLAIQDKITRRTYSENQNSCKKQLKNWWCHSSTVKVSTTGLTASPRRSFCRRSKSQPVLVVNASQSSFTKADIPLSSSTLLSLATSAYKVFYDPAQFSQSGPLLPGELLPNTIIKRELHLEESNNGNQQQRPQPCSPSIYFSDDWRFHYACHPFSLYARGAKVLQSACKDSLLATG